MTFIPGWTEEEYKKYPGLRASDREREMSEMFRSRQKDYVVECTRQEVEEYEPLYAELLKIVAPGNSTRRMRFRWEKKGKKIVKIPLGECVWHSGWGFLVPKI